MTKRRFRLLAALFLSYQRLLVAYVLSSRPAVRQVHGVLLASLILSCRLQLESTTTGHVCRRKVINCGSVIVSFTSEHLRSSIAAVSLSSWHFIDKLYSPQMVVIWCRLRNNSIYILMKVSKLVRWLSDLINLSCRLARENEVELLTTKFCNLHIFSVKKFNHKSVCHKIDRVQLRFVQIQHLEAIQQNRHTFIFYHV